MDEDWESEIDTKPSIVPVYSNLVSEQENGESSNRFNRNEDGPRNHSFARRGGYSGNECDQNNGFSRRGGFNSNEDRQRDGFSRRGGYSAGDDGQRSNDFSRRGLLKPENFSWGEQFAGLSASGFNADNSGQKRNDSSRRGGYNEDGQQSSNYSRRGGYSADEDGQRSNNFSRRGGFSQSNSDFDAHSRGRGGGTGGRGFSSAGGYRGKNEEIGVEPVKGQEENDEQGPKVTYIPPPPPETEDAIFAHYQTGINFDKYDEILVQVSGDDVPPALMSFEEANLSDTLNKNISRAGYLKLTPVQKYSIPIILAGRDLMACAQTGSGKTAAFLLPILAHMMKEGITASHFKELQEPEAIIIAPTRELINQIYLEARKFSYGTCIRPVVIYGGTQTGHSIRQILQGCNILCATPGRLMDIINKGKIGLSNIKYLVFDEADRMLDMGFKPDIEKLTSYKEMPSKENRQTLMFSATYPEAIQRLAGQFLKPDYLFLTVGQVGGACSDVEQTILEVGQFEKKDKLLEILQTIGNERTLVFVKTKKKADYIALILCQEQLPSTSIHGDRPQQERETALWKFRSGECPILVATSVAARGLDIENVQHVINLDLPKEIDEYVHRIGRTGRCGNIGKAISFFDRKDDEDIGIARSLVKVLSDAQQEVPVWLEEIAFSAHGTSSYNPRGNVFASVDSRKVGVVKEKESVGSVGFHQDANEDTWE